jgi:hypothetical protein
VNFIGKEGIEIPRSITQMKFNTKIPDQKNTNLTEEAKNIEDSKNEEDKGTGLFNFFREKS